MARGRPGGRPTGRKMDKIVLWDEGLRDAVINLIKGLNLEKPWSVTIEKYVERRSLSQNNLYWQWVGILARETGNDPDSVHEALKARFLIPKEITFMGEKTLYRSSSKLDTREMSEYMDRVYALATAEMGILLPVPDEADALTKPEAA